MRGRIPDPSMHFMRYERSDFTSGTVRDEEDVADTRVGSRHCDILTGLRVLARMFGLIRGGDQGEYALLARQATKMD